MNKKPNRASARAMDKLKIELGIRKKKITPPLALTSSVQAPPHAAALHPVTPPSAQTPPPNPFSRSSPPTALWRMTDEVFQDVIQKAAASAVAKDRERVERKTGSTSRVLFYGHPLLSPAAAALEEEEQDWPFFAMEEMEKMHAIEAEEMSEFLSKWFATEEEPFTEPFGSSLEKDGCGLLAKI